MTESGRTLRFLADQPVSKLRGVGDKKVAALAQLGIESVFDLLTTYPRRWIDFTVKADVSDLAEGEQAAVLGEVVRARGGRMRRGGSMVTLTVRDHSGSIPVVFYNQPWRSSQLPVGSKALFLGKLTAGRAGPQMSNPFVDVVVDESEPEAGKIITIYPASAKAGLNSWEIRRWVAEALERSGRFAEPLDAPFRQQLGLVDRTAALRGIHTPATLAEKEAARRRLAFDELFRLQLSLVLRRRARERDARAIRHHVSPLEVTGGRPGGGPETLVEQFLRCLPFEPTGAQRRALAGILAELAGPLPMHRLLQGDVGSGKTVVALATLLAGVQGGHQGAFMVPTEVLAEQHFAAVEALLDGLNRVHPVTVALLTNRTTAAERVRLHAGLLDGSVDIVVGTHALLTDDVRFHSLGVVVIDEQHRFGVEQRAALRAKGGEDADPDLLIMTATPIPRTAAIVVFGDIDMTKLDELPPGRSPVTTKWARTAPQVEAVWKRVRSEVAAGHRAYVVCPLVEESEKVEARSVTEELERLRTETLPGLRLGLLHGQMRSAEKEAAMAAFRSGETEVLVATTVIEVGVDVPEATVMVIEDAHRFGMAQLHQLRGRVGRSALPSWCFLLGSLAEAGPAGRTRLEAMERTNDGFELAEVDLELRGEGTILGARQKGRSDLRLASLKDDRELLAEARRVAEAVTEHDPQLTGHPLLGDELRLFLSEEEAEFLFKS